MSKDIEAEVWKHAPVEQGTLLVLLAMADNADTDSRECWPGIKSLARRARLGERQVKNCIATLQSRGIITVQRNASRARTNLYTIATVEEWKSRCAKIAPPPDAADVQPVAPLDGQSSAPLDVQPISPKPSEEPSEEPSDLRSQKSSPLRLVPPEAEKMADPFDEFWSAYPKCFRKTGKSNAADTFRRITSGKHRKIPKTPAETIIGALRRWAGSDRCRDEQYIPAPTSWLNGEGWLPFVEDGEEELSPARRRQRAIAANGGTLR